MTPCSTCPATADCHSPARPDATCRDRNGFWSLEGRAEWEALHGNVYPPQARGIDHQREQIEAARRLLESKGYRVLEKAA